MVQILCMVLLVCLGFYCFHFYPMERRNTKKLVFSALIVVITLVIKRLTIMVPIFGAESLKIGFEYIPLMVAGFMLSPSYAFVIGVLVDVMGLVITPTGFPFFGFTLNEALIGVIPAVIHHHSLNIDEKRFSKIVIGLIALLGISGSLFIGLQTKITISSAVHVITFQEKAILISLCLLASLAFIIALLISTKKVTEENRKNLMEWILMVIAVEVLITFLLTPIWLNVMYGIPYIASLCVRIIKECFIIPIEVVIGYSLIKVTKSLKL